MASRTSSIERNTILHVIPCVAISKEMATMWPDSPGRMRSAFIIMSPSVGRCGPRKKLQQEIGSRKARISKIEMQADLIWGSCLENVSHQQIRPNRATCWW